MQIANDEDEKGHLAQRLNPDYRTGTQLVGTKLALSPWPWDHSSSRTSTSTSLSRRLERRKTKDEGGVAQGCDCRREEKQLGQRVGQFAEQELSCHDTIGSGWRGGGRQSWLLPLWMRKRSSIIRKPFAIEVQVVPV